MLLPIAVVLALAAGLVYVKILHSPISLTFLSRSIEEGIGSELGGRVARIDSAELGIGPRGGVEMRLRNLRVFETDGDVIASAPLAAIELSGPAFWSLRLVPARVDLIEPRISAAYSADGQLTLTFNRDGDLNMDGAGESSVAAEHTPAQINLTQTLAMVSERARDGLGVSPYLRAIGLRDAIVSLDDRRTRTQWTIPRATVAIDRKKSRAVVSGSATIESSRGPWSFEFESRALENGALSVGTSLEKFFPSALAQAFPSLAALAIADIPLSGEMRFNLAESGELLSAEGAIQANQGAVHLPGFGKDAAFAIDNANLTFAYDGKMGKATIRPSTLVWGDSRLTIAGSLTRAAKGEPSWFFDLAGSDGRLTAEEFDGASLAIDKWALKGAVLPGREIIQVSSFTLGAGEGGVDLAGEINANADLGGAHIEGAISPISLATLKVLWPRFIAPGARTWIAQHAEKGTATGTRFRYASGVYADGAAPETAKHGHLEMAVEAAGVLLRPVKGLPPLDVPRATIELRGKRLEIAIPESSLVLDAARRVPLSSGRFSSEDIDAPAPTGEIAFSTRGPLAPVLAVLNHGPINLGKQTGLPLERIDGNIDGAFKVTLPLLETASAKSVKIEGKALVTDGHAKQIGGAYDVHGASVAFDFTEQAIDAQGEMLLGGVPAKINWQRILDAPADKQPPLRITATLDNADRTQLGLDVNHILLGEAPIEVTVTPGASDDPLVRVRADLTNAELLFEGIAWRKPPGRPAVLECEVETMPGKGTELKNFKIEGDGISIAGRLGLDAQTRLRDFHFPYFSLDVVTRLNLQGTVRSDNVLAVKARGEAFDGRNLFRALFSAGKITDQELKPNKPRAGLDVDADIGTVIGFSEVALRRVKAKFSKRSDKLTAFDGSGVLDGGKPVTVLLRQKDQPRILVAESPDAGQAFRLTGFYPNIDGGAVRLEVDLDGRGPAEKTGVLGVDRFRVLGDPVVGEVFGVAKEVGPGTGSSGRRRVTRQAFDFDTLRAQFSVGHGQFVLEDAYIRGGAIGASLRGKVDYTVQWVNLGGTYVPLHGLNAALRDFPLFGPLFTGLRGEGVFGITFSITGPVAQPEVNVNPLSLIAPGIFREIFEMTNPNPRVQPRTEQAPKGPARVGPGASRALIDKSRASAGGGVAVMESWSSETFPAPKPQ